MIRWCEAEAHAQFGNIYYCEYRTLLPALPAARWYVFQGLQLQDRPLIIALRITCTNYSWARRGVLIIHVILRWVSMLHTGLGPEIGLIMLLEVRSSRTNSGAITA